MWDVVSYETYTGLEGRIKSSWGKVYEAKVHKCTNVPSVSVPHLFVPISCIHIHVYTYSCYLVHV